MTGARRELGIWWLAFGYFACYAPYSALTKALSEGLLPGMTHGQGIPGPTLLPSTALASMVGMFVFLTAAGWWRHAGQRRLLGRSWPCPNRWTFLSGLCTAAVIATTTLAYTISGVSIVFMMLLMRGGLLMIAPVVDALSRRRVRWFSWVGLLLSFDALLVAFSSRGGFGITLVAALDVTVYLASYLVRLKFMSRLAKSDDPDASKRFFVEEQMVATPAFVLALGAVAIAGPMCGEIGLGDIGVHVRSGFTTFFASPVLWVALVVGMLSQGTGIFGGLILLDKRENSFCVPVNRASSVLAGVVASFCLWAFAEKQLPGSGEMLGALFIVQGIFVLALPTFLEKRQARALAAQAMTAPLTVGVIDERGAAQTPCAAMPVEGEVACTSSPVPARR